MISLLEIPPEDMSATALFLVVRPGPRGLEVEAAILLVVSPGGGCVTKQIKGADAFLDFSFFGVRCPGLFFPFPTQQQGMSHI